jgi:hypothetical protein
VATLAVLRFFGVIVPTITRLVRKSTSSQMRPERHTGVGWHPQRLVQVRVVEDVPEPIYCLAMSQRLIGKHTLDRSQRKRQKHVAAALQRRSYGRGTDEFAKTQHRCGITKVMGRG